MSWIDIDNESPFSLQNIPFGIISTDTDATPRPATIVGNTVLDLKSFAELGGFNDLNMDKDVFKQPTLNAFAQLGRNVHNSVRMYLQHVFTKNGQFAERLETNDNVRERSLIEYKNVQMHVPMAIGDYTDFYVGLNHAYNCGVMFRGPENALQPNYYHLPVGYHGRASSIVVSGTNLHRPKGQILKDPTVKIPSLEECKKLDFELEFACFVSKSNKLGEPIDINDAEDYIFGYVLMNDWSARDIQAWEYVPLGPFTAKSFGTSISPWVVLHDALEPFRCEGLKRPEDKQVLPYLQSKDEKSVFDMNLEIEVKTEDKDKAVISKVSSKNLLFSFPQMVTHHTVTGCNLQTGDLLGSGTISGVQGGDCGSMFELSQNGQKDVKIGNSKRRFLQDGDTVTFRGYAGELGERVGFGPVSGTILSAVAK